MFWKRKEEVITGSLEPHLAFPIPTKKEYKNMLELLRDAEKYDIAGEKEIAKNTLKTLNDYIIEYCK